MPHLAKYLLTIEHLHSLIDDDVQWHASKIVTERERRVTEEMVFVLVRTALNVVEVVYFDDVDDGLI